MAFLIGTDEAGYGPNLGPLVVTATVWEVPDGLLKRNLYTTLKQTIANSSPDKDDPRVWIGDSKLLYKPGSGLANLERGVLAALAATSSRPASWQQLLLAVDPSDTSDARRLPWYERFDEAIPIDISANAAADAGDLLQTGLQRSNITLRRVRSAIVYADRFNGLLDQCGNKSSALSKVTLDLVAEVIADLSGPILVRCDKHGGRNKYGPLLQQRFLDSLVLVRHEGREESRYQSGPAKELKEFRFTAKGDRHLPSALASMFSKYIREVAMRGFNTFWCDQLHELKPTAGYPTDARRFKKEITKVQSKLGISDHILWRAR
jgi:ribonuclease HII